MVAIIRPMVARLGAATLAVASVAVAQLPPTIANTSPLPGATRGYPYSVQFTTNLGVSGTWGSLTGTYGGSNCQSPATLGISLTISGVLSGTLLSGTPVGSATLCITVANRAGSDTRVFSLPVNAVPTAISAQNLVGITDTTYTNTLSVTGGTAPFSWQVYLGNLPSGLTLDANAGVISGVPTSVGTFTPTIRAVDAHGAAVNSVISLTIVAPLSIATSTPLSPHTVNSAYGRYFSASGGTTPYSWSLAGGTLPPGTTLANVGYQGFLSGTTTAAGTYNFTIRVTDSTAGTPLTTTKAFSIVINPRPAISTLYLYPATQNTPYPRMLAATDGTPPLTWSSGALPDGLTLSSSGAISGTPPATGTTTVSFTVKDIYLVSDTNTLDITVNPPPSIGTTSLVNGRQGIAYSQTAQAAGGTAPLVWSVAVGALPAGLSLSSNSGVISGTPTGAGSTSFTLRVSDGNGAFDDRPLTITVIEQLLLTCPPLPPLIAGVSVSYQCNATGGVPPYAWSTSAGAPPSGLVVSAGSLTGAPITPGNFSFTLRVTDSDAPAQAQTQSFSGTVTAPSLTLSPTTLTFNHQIGAGAPSSQAVSITSANPSSGVNFTVTPGPGCGWFSFSIAAGATPASGQASVNPVGLTAGTYTCTDTFTATGGSTQTLTATLNIAGAPVVSATPSALTFQHQLGSPLPVSQTVSLTSSAAPLSFTATESATWLSTAPPTGSTPATLTVYVDPSALVAGTYSGTIAITSSQAGNSPLAIPVTLNVTTAPNLTATPSSLTFAYQQGGAMPSPQNIAIGSSGSALNFNVSSSAAWLGITPASGTTPGNLSVSVAPGSLAAGAYAGTITVSSGAAGNSPLSITVTLAVTALASLTVTPNALNFTALAGGAPPAAQDLSVAAGNTAQRITVTATSSPSGWLSAAPVAASTPAAIVVRVNPVGLAPGSYSGALTVEVTGVQGSPKTVAVTLVLTAGVQPLLTVAPQSLTFTYRPDLGLPAPQSVSVIRSGALATFTAAATTRSGVNWLAVSPASGNANGAVMVAIQSVSSLAVGAYEGTVTIQSPGATPPSRTVPVTLLVEAKPAGAAQLIVEPPYLLLSAVQGSPPQEGRISLRNPGGELALFMITASVPWITFLSPSGTLQAGSIETPRIDVNPSGLAPGTHRGEIVVRGAGTALEGKVLVYLTVASASRLIRPSLRGLRFDVAEGQSWLPADGLAVTNSGLGVMPWTLTSQTLSGGNWLRATATTAVSTAGSADNPRATVFVNHAGLAPGRYYGSVNVSAEGAANSPQSVTVLLNVLKREEGATQVQPTGLLFAAERNGPNPWGQPVTMNNLSGRPLSFTSAVDAAWISATPSGMVPPGDTFLLMVLVRTATLPAGIHQGNVRVAFDDGSVRTISVTAIVAAPAPQSAAKPLGTIPNCRPSRLVPQFLTLEEGFVVAVQEPMPLRVLVKDDCDTAITGGAAFVSIENEPAELSLTHESGGVWGGTWTPARARDIQRIAATALSVGTQRLGGQVVRTGMVLAAAATAAASASQIRNAASLGESQYVALGSWVSIFGDRLAEREGVVRGLNYPRQMEGTEVLLGGTPLPLYYVNPRQVNALVPYGVAPNTIHQLIVRRGITQSVSTDVIVADIQPGIYTMTQDGKGQGAILGSFGLAAPAGYMPGVASRPVRKGESVSIFSTGLGPVSNAPQDGTPAPVSPLAATIASTQVIVGGVTVPAAFSGLAPGFIGLYQVNVEIPVNAPSGPSVPLTLRVGSAVSNTATIAIE